MIEDEREAVACFPIFKTERVTIEEVLEDVLYYKRYCFEANFPPIGSINIFYDVDSHLWVMVLKVCK